MAVSSQGTKVYVKHTNNTYVLIPGIQSGAAEGGESETVDVTAIDETSPATVAGFPSSQTYSFPIWWTPSNATHRLLDSYKSNSNNVAWKIVTTETANNTFYFNGQIISLPSAFSFEQNSALQKTLTVAVNNFRETE